MFLCEAPLALLAGYALAMGACTQDPRYVQGPEDIEAGGPDADPDMPATAQIVLPIRLEESTEAEERAALAAELGVDVPYVTLSDLDISLEWTIRNLDDSAGEARIMLNGANEYFAYVAVNFVVDPDEEPTPPPLAGDIPLPLEALATISGVFREDQIREAAIDLELITRGALNPFAAMLEHHEDITEIALDGATPIPLKALGNIIRFDITLLSDRHVVMEYAVRLRSNRRPNLVHDEGLEALEGELSVFAPADFVPPPPLDPGP